MVEYGCSDVVRVGGDLALAPGSARDGLAAHRDNCRDCAKFVSQVATTRTILRRRAGRGSARPEAVPRVATTPTANIGSLRSTLLARAELLDPSNAEDLTQQALAVGLGLQRRDSHPRGIAELTAIMHALSDASARFDGRVLPAVDITAPDRARASFLDGLDADADEPELYYPDLYPADADVDGWVNSPGKWTTSSDILGPVESGTADEVYDVVDKALDELPEPLGDLMAMVDIQGSSLPAAAQLVGLDEAVATAAIARARNHVRGRLDEYLKGGALAN